MLRQNYQSPPSRITSLDTTEPPSVPPEEHDPDALALRDLQDRLLDKARRVVEDVERRLRHVLEEWPDLQRGRRLRRTDLPVIPSSCSPGNRVGRVHAVPHSNQTGTAPPPTPNGRHLIRQVAAQLHAGRFSLLMPVGTAIAS
jgi:hypothetical protein